MIRASALEALTAHARADPGRECCGFLIGTAAYILEVAPATNVADDPSRRYEISPADYLAQIRRARGTPYAVIGAYHSHPRSAPDPSATDLALAFQEFIYLIAGPVAGPMDVRAYRLEDDRFVPLQLTVED